MNRNISKLVGGKKGISTLIGIIIIIAVAVVAFGGVFVYQYFVTQQVEPTACTKEAKVCLDGSTVGRTGPNCEFAQCPATPNQTAGWKTYEDANRDFWIKYPSLWTYQKFSCDPDDNGVAFCPLAGNSPSNCSQSCSMSSPSAPIYFYLYDKNKPAFTESDSLKYLGDPNISLYLTDSKYREIYTEMISTFIFNK
ncbi:MAG: hypothetical protein Q8K40_00315 [Ignavibacteria bacterium]|nr:hypothetical protein [Ignavibacteria bacterium]